MTEQQSVAYQSHVRGAATWILLGKVDAAMNAEALVRIYGVNLTTAIADIDAIVQAERAKVGGVFETTRTPTNAQTGRRDG